MEIDDEIIRELDAYLEKVTALIQEVLDAESGDEDFDGAWLGDRDNYEDGLVARGDRLRTALQPPIKW